MDKLKNLSEKLDNEVSIWKRFVAGDDKAFAQIFDLYSDRLFRYGMKFVSNEDLVKDCIQDLFVKIFKSRSGLPLTTNLSFYLFKALKHKIIDTIQKDKHLIYYSSGDLPFMVEFSFDPEEEEQQRQEEQAYDLDIKEKFKEVLSLLSDRQKEAMYLRYKMGMDYEEISQLLDINYQSTRNLMYRAMQQIKSSMDLGVFILLLLKYIN